MSKSSLEKILKADGHYAGDLVSLDFKSESLHMFLENVVQLVNQHSQRINSLELEKMETEAAKKSHLTLFATSKLSPAILKELPMGQPLAKGDTLEESVGLLGSNLSAHCQATHFIFEGMKKLTQRVEAVAAQMSSFETQDNVKEAVRKAGVHQKKTLDDQSDRLLNRIKEVEMKTNLKISEYDNTTKEIEKKTLWKINQCESALVKKITPEYVQRAIVQSEARIMSDIANNKNHERNELKFTVETLKGRVDVLVKNVDEAEKENKSMLKELEEAAKQLESKEKAEQDKRELQTKIKQLLLKIDRLEKREDPADLQLRISKITLEQQEKQKAMQEKIKKLDHELESINNVMSSLGGGENGGMDPHKLCHMDGEVKRLRDSNRTNENKIQILQDQLKTKLLVFEERIMTTLGMLKGQDNFVSREQLYESLTRMREPVTEKLNENQQLINELAGKMTKLEQFEKNVKRKIKEMTRGDDLNKILDMKLNISQAEAQFASYAMKMQNMELILNKIRMEIQSNSQFLHSLQQEMNQPEEGVNIIGPRQKVFPAKCLGCGYKHVPSVHDNNMMQGSDGKYYKVDFGPSFNSSQKEVYGVTASQIAMYDNSGKKRMISTLTKPATVRSNVRPGSAKHF